MDISKAFDDFQSALAADKDALKEARRRRDLFVDAFNAEADVADAYPSGSLARKTQLEPIHDVDVIVVFEASEYPEWDEPGDSAEEALVEVQKRVTKLLGSEGTGDVHHTLIRNHSVTCYLDPPETEGAFTVDVTTALPGEGTAIRIPEKDSKDWIDSNPKRLIGDVEKRQGDWSHFVPLVRCLKRWKKEQNVDMKSLLVEVLALNHLPETTRPEGVSRFFTSAAAVIYDRIEDPAGFSEIQPDLDTAQAHAALTEAGDLAAKAVAAQDRGDTDEAACYWREIFGKDFPEPDGGCTKKDEGDAGAGFFIGTGAAATPRPIVDAPQG